MTRGRPSYYDWTLMWLCALLAVVSSVLCWHALSLDARIDRLESQAEEEPDD